ncbi:hypothetical protein F5888DRAFT_756910 [Russula emetica]|nr:hypothetical protein F5888DRAFT_756910 [Russula emetica]
MDQSTTTQAYRPGNLSHRRGSVSASDPFGIHVEQNLSDERALRSRLTIVRVLPEEIQDHQDGHRHDSSPASSLQPRTGQSRRLSFASSSFAHEPLLPATPNSPPSYTSRKRRSATSLYAQRTSLTPQQLCDLVQSSTQPSHFAKSEAIETSPSPRSPVHSPDHSSSFTSQTTANFHPLPDGQFLPFLDRPTEVSDFINTNPTNRLMALLELAFPVHLCRQRTRTEDAQPPFGAANQTSGSCSHLPTKQSYRDAPPLAWSYDMLLEWMLTVTRSEADDAAWIHAIRTCVMAHSEQICATLLIALGVPMEGGADLDVVSLPVGVPDTDLVLPELFTACAGGPLAQLPTLPEAPSNEGEDAFQLEILPVTSETTDVLNKLPYTQHRSRSGSTSSWSPSSGSSSRLSTTMESIDENDHEQDVEIGAESLPFESEGHVAEEHPPGEVTARGGSPMGATTAKASDQIPLSMMEEQWENDGGQFTDDDHWRRAWEQVENCHGLSISTCARPAADPSLPSSVPHSAMPHAVASPVRPKQRRNTVQVSHVLSGAPGYAGFTWRPGGPLFPMSFTGATGGGEGLSAGLEKDGNSNSFATSNPVLKPRSRSRTKRTSPTSGSRSKTKVEYPLTPPNSPVAFFM